MLRPGSTPEPGTGRAWLDGVIAAVLTPFDSSGALHLEGVTSYAQRIAASGVSALAVGAHTGRGAHLTTQDLASLVAEYARAVDLPIVCGVGVAPGTDPTTAAEIERSLITRALAVAAAGADALLCAPPPRPRDSGPQWLAALHERLAAETGLPVIGFILHAQAGAGPTYDRDDLAALSTARGVAAVKIATLDDAVACQDFILQCRAAAPGLTVLTGEDRMFGPSLMWGAQGALVGLGAALPELTVAVHDQWRRAQYRDFLAASARLDDFARLTFSRPFAGYVQRMAWAAQWEGALPTGLSYDPWAPAGDSRDGFLRSLDAFAEKHGWTSQVGR